MQYFDLTNNILIQRNSNFDSTNKTFLLIVEITAVR